MSVILPHALSNLTRKRREQAIENALKNRKVINNLRKAIIDKVKVVNDVKKGWIEKNVRNWNKKGRRKVVLDRIKRRSI